jgi:very-short-patch-repair endonuclease
MSDMESDSPMSSDTSQMISVILEIAPKINFACHQNAFPVLRELRIENHSLDERFENVTVTLRSNPAFLEEKAWRVDRLPANGAVSINDHDLTLDGAFLLSLADSMRGTLTISVEVNGSILAEMVNDIEILAHNEWGGAGCMPELLAAFVMPNDPIIDRILRGASEALRRAGKKDSMDGYQSKSRQRVWEIASAIYSAVANLDLTYAVPPASFEMNGQKIRLPGQVVSGKIGTCLDTALLFASAFEQAGLNPVIVLPEGHAMVGVWLQPEELSTIVIDEAETLRKRVQLKELVVIETTFVTSHPAPPFSKAIAAASAIIEPDHDGSFHAAVDVKRARMHRISPLGFKSGRTDTKSEVARDTVDLPLEEAPALPCFDTSVDEDDKETPEGRLERWQRRLLDLSLRNPLLNHRAGATSLRILCPDPAKLEDKLAEGARIAIQALPQPTSLRQDEALHRQRTGEVITEEYAREALERNQVLVDLPEAELSKRAVEIYRKAQTALQEGGSNTLYLAVGFLLWKRDEKDEKRFRAPLILLPVALERKSVRSGVKMVIHDDEPKFNTTLLQMLRKDFSIDIKGLEPDLPADESGIDVARIWRQVRQAVKETPGFEVVEEVVLGHFSFAKFLMWKDLLDRTDALRKSPVVRHLIDTPRDPYPSDVEFVDQDCIDRMFSPSDLMAPLPADGSQMAAVATSDRGKDFVIIGPPGTGKSQTIANMIAHLLGKGKTVLFVSEKTAALEVVYRRLIGCGLGRFCLELHSNKASKADVLKQLGESWNTGAQKTSDAWKKEADKLRELRDQLNGVVAQLHMKRRNGLTVHYAIGVKVRDDEDAQPVRLSWPCADHHDERTLTALHEVVDKLAIQAAAVRDFTHSPFTLVIASEWSPQWETELADAAGRLAGASLAAGQACEAFCGALEISVPDRTLARLEALAELAAVVLESYQKESSYALEADGVDQIKALEEAVLRLRSYADKQASLSCAYDPMAWRRLDGVALHKRWWAAEAFWWLKRIIVRRRIINEMRVGGAEGRPDPVKDCLLLMSLREEGLVLDRLSERLSVFKNWKGHDTEPQMVDGLADMGRRVRAVVGKLADSVAESVELRNRVCVALRDGNDLLSQQAVVGRTAKGFVDALAIFMRAVSDFESKAGGTVREAFGNDAAVLENVRAVAETIIKRHQDLKDWCAWRKRRGTAVDYGLMPLVESIEQGRVSPDEISDTFETAFCAWWSRAVIGEDEVLRHFSSPEHNVAITQFRESDARFQKLTAAYIAASLRGGIPGQEDVRRNSQWGTLQHELQKKMRHKPVRQLVLEIPEVITKLAPCLMMSPLSVAQYLPPEQQLFDVVIFDEASQITVWDAVGAIARGKNVIVAGDPKQMPPTNFFARTEEDPDGEVDSDGDLESILDEMRGASIPSRTLNLHYRSRKESLIAFSNAKYYDNGLITFPAPVAPPDKGVRLIRPQGFYARGGARHNEGEAKAIVAEVVRRLTHKDEGVRALSIGVVTFNSEQQSLIENLLDDARAKNTEIEPAFSREHTLEPVFVKNLETVQGDERDVILFSITYGPDQSGHVTMNFGPLNRQGGERRLNVAMTRARSEMLVFSTLSADQIDLARTQAKAIKDLKHFIEYAERGPSVLGAFVEGSVGDFESPFEVAVSRELKEKGWDIHPQIGVSAYRVDLGVVHPGKPGIYLAGIECDGAMYHSSSYARERDKIRQSVLEGLGWTLFRVWSTDWWTNKTKATEDLHAKLVRHLEVVQGESKDEADDDGACDDTTSGTETVRDGDQVITLPSGTSGTSETDDDGIKRERRYVCASFSDPSLKPDPDAFYCEEYQGRIICMIEHVVDMEGPIHEEMLVRRLARHHGFLRSGRQIREIVVALAGDRRRKTRESVGVFYWPMGPDGERCTFARSAGRDDDLKKPEYICSEEICAINVSFSLNGDPVEIARVLGVARLSKTSRERIEEALMKRDGC